MATAWWLYWLVAILAGGYFVARYWLVATLLLAIGCWLVYLAGGYWLVYLAGGYWLVANWALRLAV